MTGSRNGLRSGVRHATKPAPRSGSTVSRRDVLKTGAAVAAGSALPLTHSTTAKAAKKSEPNPMRLWYRRPAEEWLEALPIGNGRIGAMVWGGVETERLQLNEDTVWAGGPHDYAVEGLEVLPEIRRLIFEEKWKEAQNLADEHFMGRPTEQMQYQPVGDLVLTFPGGTEFADYYRELDLTKALTSVTYTSGGVRFKREAFASHPHQVLVVRLTADKPRSVSFTATFTSPQRTTVTPVDHRTLALDGVSGDAEGLTGSVRFRALARACAEGGRVTTDGTTLAVEAADAVTLLISMGTSYVNYLDVSADPKPRAAAPLDRATTTSYTVLRSRHIADYKRFFDRVDIDLGTSDAVTLPTDERVPLFREGRDPQLAALYFQFGRYLLLSCSRAPGQPANLQGLWNQDMLPAWQSKYTLNINCEMNYWPAGPANLIECYEPLFQMIEELAESGARTARVMYGAPGWVAHHNTDGWRGSAPVDYAFYGVWPTGGAWLALSFWDHYRYTGDLDTLRTYYPVIRGSVEFFLHTLVEDPKTGWLVTNPSHSPEIGHHEIDDENVSICAGPTMDMQILRDLFDAFSSAAELLGRDPGLAEQARTARSRLAPHQIGAAGQLQEWLEDWEESRLIQHRHVSHLYGLFPSEQITPRRTPELAAAARRSLELRGPGTSGWSLAWRINFWARLEDPVQVYDRLRALLSPGKTAPNLFDLHPPFQIDGNFGGLRGIIEMLMQSHSGELSLLPALPAEFPTGRVRGLRAHDGFEVDISWRDGSLHHARLTSLLGRRAVVRARTAVEVIAHGKPVPVERPEPTVVSFTTNKGASYVLRPRRRDDAASESATT